MVFDDALLLPFLKPEISGHKAIMLVDFAIALLPITILAGRQSQPTAKLVGRKLGSFHPIGNEINDRITRIVRYPYPF